MTLRTRAILAAFALTLMAVPAAALPGDVLPKENKFILWWTPQEQAAGYRRMEDVVKVHTIRRGAHVHPQPRAAGPEPRIAFTYQGLSWTPEAMMEADHISGLLILKDGKIVLERYGLGRTSKDRWTSFSVAKSVTSTLIGAAIKDGFIKSLDDQVVTYIPELAGSAYDGVTVRHLITMTSGVRWNEDYSDPKSDVALSDQGPRVPGKNTTVTYMSHLPRQDPPGTRFVYKTGETDLAGILLSNAVHKTMSEYASEKIWKPYGMEQDGIWMLDSSGHERGGCCISMTLRDYGRMGQYMLDGGAGQLPDGWIAQATVNALPPPAAGARAQQYGYFWWIEPDNTYEAIGVFGQMIYINPAKKIVIVTNSAWNTASERPSGARRTAFVNAAVAALSGSALPAPR